MSYKSLCNCSRVMCFITETNYNICRSSAIWLFKAKLVTSPVTSLTPKFSFFRKIHASPKKWCDVSEEESGDSVVALSFQNSAIVEDHFDQFRNTLYPDSKDPLLLNLKSCDNIEHVITIVNSNIQLFTTEHYCQLLMVVWHIIFNTRDRWAKELSLGLYRNEESDMSQNIFPVILKSLEYLSAHKESLTPEELVCCVLYSNRIGINLRHPTIQKLLVEISKLLTNMNADIFSISALSRLTITFNDNNELWTKMILIKTLPLLYIHFDRCQSIDEYRALSISMLSTIPYLREELLLEYVALTEELLRNGLVSYNDSSAVVKGLMVLSHIYHKPEARYMSYRLLQKLRGGLDKLFPPHLYEIQKIVWRQAEPLSTMVELDLCKKNFSFESPREPDFSPHYLPLMRLPINSRGALFLKEFIQNSNTLENLMAALGHLSKVQLDVCNSYWSKVAQLLHSENSDENDLLRICIRYINFSKVTGLYRHRQLESTVLSLITSELVNGTAALEPRKLAVLASFVLSYDQHQGTSSLSNNIAPRLISMIGQFDAISCFWISKGLGERLKKNKDLKIFLQVDSALNNRVREIIDTKNIRSISTYNTVLRSCVSRNQSMESDIILDIINRWESLEWSELTSRSLRNLVSNLYIMNALVPPVMERLVDYCLANSPYIATDTVGKLLYLCYHLGYSPQHLSSFCAIAGDLVTRHHHFLAGLSLLQVALGLTFFNHLPRPLIQAIFTVKFLETLDTEIKNCYAKDKYPLRVRQTLMELNRSVCLDQPEADVPWFHSKFCEEQKVLGRLDRQPKTLLFTDVYSTLLSLVGDKKYITTEVYSPYGYLIDMQLNLDASLNPLSFKETTSIAYKLALQLYYSDSYTVYEQRLKGYYQMKQRHLEILGYKVIGISDSLWNSMFMAEPKAKQDYLKNLIWPS